MTVGRRQYNEAEMLQMQRDAELRVREMQARTRRVAADTQENDFPARNRNWSTSADIHRQYAARRSTQNRQRQRAQWSTPTKEPEPVMEESEAAVEADIAEEAAAPPPPPLPPAEDSPKKSGTIVGDIMDALGLDEDYLLIIGLLLILINQRADTTLILALAYLLI